MKEIPFKNNTVILTPGELQRVHASISERKGDTPEPLNIDPAAVHAALLKNIDAIRDQYAMEKPGQSKKRSQDLMDRQSSIETRTALIEHAVKKIEDLKNKIAWLEDRMSERTHVKLLTRVGVLKYEIGSAEVKLSRCLEQRSFFDNIRNIESEKVAWLRNRIVELKKEYHEKNIDLTTIERFGDQAQQQLKDYERDLAFVEYDLHVFRWQLERMQAGQDAEYPYDQELKAA